MNEVQLFNFKNNDIRTIKIDGTVWFLAKDVAKSFGYVRGTHSIMKNVSNNNQLTLKWRASTKSVQSQLWKNKNDFSHKLFVNESGLYSLALHSNLPVATQFHDWVTDEVLPSINHTGSYSIQASAEANEISGMPKSQILLMASQYAQESEKNKALLEESEKQVKKMKPKTHYYDDIGSNKGTIYVGDEAKALQKCGVKTGANRFFKWLRDNHYLGCKHGSSWNVPTQYAINLGVLTFVPVPTTLKNGIEFIAKTPLVTGKGQHYFYHKLAKKDGDK